MKITEKELRKLVRESVAKKLNEAVTDKKKEPSKDWVKFVEDVDKFTRETIENAKELVAAAEKLKDEALEAEDKNALVTVRKTKEYQTADRRMNYIKNLITKLSAVDFDSSEFYYKGKI